MKFYHFDLVMGGATWPDRIHVRDAFHFGLIWIWLHLDEALQNAETRKLRLWSKSKKERTRRAKSNKWTDAESQEQIMNGGEDPRATNERTRRSKSKTRTDVKSQEQTMNGREEPRATNERTRRDKRKTWTDRKSQEQNMNQQESTPSRSIATRNTYWISMVLAI